MRKPNPNPKSFSTMERWICRELSLTVLCELRFNSASREEYENLVRSYYKEICENYE